MMFLWLKIAGYYFLLSAGRKILEECREIILVKAETEGRAAGGTKKVLVETVAIEAKVETLTEVEVETGMTAEAPEEAEGRGTMTAVTEVPHVAGTVGEVGQTTTEGVVVGPGIAIVAALGVVAMIAIATEVQNGPSDPVEGPAETGEEIGLVRNAAPIISPEETNALSVVPKNQRNIRPQIDLIRHRMEIGCWQ